jgi:hypothetical protein
MFCGVWIVRRHVRDAASRDFWLPSRPPHLPRLHQCHAGIHNPRVDALLNSREVAFEKPNRRGVRPIAIWEAWLRLAAIVCIRLLPHAGSSLAPLQLGVGTPGGAENIGHAINAALCSDPDSTVVLSHDWANAFNTIHQADLLPAVACRHPPLVPSTTPCTALIPPCISSLTTIQAPSTLSLPAGCAKGTPSGPSSSHWCFNALLRPLLQHTLPNTPLLCG